MNKEVKEVKKCRICGSQKLYRFLDLGVIPIPNGFLKKEDLSKSENKYELTCQLCENCGLVHLTNVVNPKIMFTNYLYVTAQSKIMLNNLTHLAYQTYKDFKLDKSSLVCDIGSNDGSLLSLFKNLGTRVLGIDPAQNLAKIAIKNGIPTEAKLFGLQTAKMIEKKYGQAKIITALNVIAHIDNLHGLLSGISHLLSADGYFITEFPYLLDLIKNKEFDTIYHEHLSYFSLKPWIYLIDKYDFEIVSVQRRRIHGGSIRLIHQRKRPKKNIAKKTLDYLLSLEKTAGLYDKKAYIQFAQEVSNLKTELLNMLIDIKKQKKRIVGYGAAAKGNVLTNFFGIDNSMLDYIIDSTPYKQGLYTPGMHIPIKPEEKLLSDMPNYALILAWNFADEIMEKQRQYTKNGGKFIIPIPKIRII
ncbi:hypothetical protein A2867_03615 [Candidatus Daviesbacteria bacterium RIFCSPHIGHO2_01_FULL_40_11]|uniref:Methyltransferase n=1 Tax=Candidatus Daviesbacteria bacterium RIFCSPHIGHO2_01_FULL_40_11 TaxID=1797762 RepID=A0A1F5JK56_9BACT|nr:MAG: hypothetical protein A2867_03615 [Candidatus Daviesbacteria bacterium RIFCSPHIGHO2_01_FULL_40_11]OGE62774.1 MAG: hypothetical protein A2964_01660 [Candidatus Daviesbacteria bacterium RIFCSPLOWO2_01_FULL_40_27]